MKKKLLTLFLVLVLLSVFIVPAFADETLGYVTDTANVLTQEGADNLAAYAQEVSEQYECGIYIVTVPDYQEISSVSVRDCAEQIYTYYNLGYGNERNGELLILSMEDRDYALIAYGDKANATFTDYGKEILCQQFLDNFRENDWYGGFRDYIAYSAEMLKTAEEGTPLDVYDDTDYNDYYDYDDYSYQRSFSPTTVVIGLVIGCVIALIACSVMKGKMKTANIQKSAAAYISNGGLQLSRAADNFTHITEVRERIQTENRTSSGGGGGTTVNSSGFSGTSGKF